MEPTHAQHDRFARERLAGYREEILETPLLLVGAGALGSALATQLAMWGFHDATVVDFDHYELSNATRVLDFPYARVRAGEQVAKCEHVTEGWRTRALAAGFSAERLQPWKGWLQELPGALWQRAAVVLAAVDHPRARFDVVRLARLHGRAVLMGGFDGEDRAITVDLFAGHRDAACYRCVTGTEPPFDATGLSCSEVGRRALAERKLPATPTLAAAAAAVMVQRLVDGLSAGFSEVTRCTRWPLAGGTSGALDGTLRRDPECGHHEPARTCQTVTLGSTVGAVLRAVEAVVPGAQVTLPGGLPVYQVTDDQRALVRVALPPWRCPKTLTLDTLPRAEGVNGSLVLEAIDLATAEAHGLTELPAACFGWTPDARVEATDAEGGVWSVELREGDGC